MKKAMFKSGTKMFRMKKTQKTVFTYDELVEELRKEHQKRIREQLAHLGLTMDRVTLDTNYCWIEVAMPDHKLYLKVNNLLEAWDLLVNLTDEVECLASICYEMTDFQDNGEDIRVFDTYVELVKYIYSQFKQ